MEEFSLCRQTGAAHRIDCPGDFALLASACVSRKRISGFQVLDNRAEIDRFGIKRLVLGDFCPVQNFEAVTFEHFFAAPALKCDDLATDAFFAGTIERSEEHTSELQSH